MVWMWSRFPDVFFISQIIFSVSLFLCSPQFAIIIAILSFFVSCLYFEPLHCLSYFMYRFLWCSLNVLLSNSNVFPNVKFNAYMCLLVPLLAYVDFVYFYYYSLIQLSNSSSYNFSVYISTLSLSPSSSLPVSFFYFGCSVWFDNVFYIISISWRGHHVLLLVAIRKTEWMVQYRC